MGCDIILHVEVKMDGKWLHWSHPDIPRNYALFAKIADVRNYNNLIPILNERRGLPGDITELTAVSHRILGGHSASWLYLDEIKQVERWWREANDDPDDEPFGPGLGSLPLSDMVGDGTGITDVRVVFWFDS